MEDRVPVPPPCAFVFLTPQRPGAQGAEVGCGPYSPPQPPPRLRSVWFEHICRVRAGRPVLGLGEQGCALWWRLAALQALSTAGRGARTRPSLPLQAPELGRVLASHASLWSLVSTRESYPVQLDLKLAPPTHQKSSLWTLHSPPLGVRVPPGGPEGGGLGIPTLCVRAPCLGAWLLCMLPASQACPCREHD